MFVAESLTAEKKKKEGKNQEIALRQGTSIVL